MRPADQPVGLRLVAEEEDQEVVLVMVERTQVRLGES